jgi:Flp pilus assembly protein TadD
VRQKRTDEAVDKLRDAAKLAPEEARFAYVAGVALHDTSKAAEGIQLLQDALSRHPYDRDILYALATYDIQSGQYSSALQRAELSQELEPDNQQYDQLLTTVRTFLHH